MTIQSLQLILDTNVVLDWLLFNDPDLDGLRHALQTQQATVLTHDFAIREWQRVLTYPQFELPANRQETLRSTYLQCARLASLHTGTADLLLPAHFPRCRDPDDQPFLALCFHAKAHALVTKDKALLKLRKRASRFGVTIWDCAALMNATPAETRA